MDKITAYLIILIVILIILLSKTCNDKKKLQESNTIYKHLGDSLNIKTKNGKEISKTSILVSNNPNEFLSIKSKDSTIIFLQGKVKQYKNQIKDGGSITTISNITNIKDSNKTIIVYQHDTIRKNDSIIVFPVYETTFDSTNNEWLRGKIIAKKNYIDLDLKSINKYTLVIGEEGKWYNKKVPFAEVTNLNPNTHTKTLKTYEVIDTRSKSKFSAGLQSGVGFTVFGLTPYIGIGISYNFISIR